MISASQFSQIQTKHRFHSNFMSERTGKRYKLPLLLTILHIPLGLLLYLSTSLAMLHPLVTFALGMYFAVSRHKRLERVALVVAYMVGSEALWRMARAPIPWEFGKYAAATVMITALVKRQNWKLPNFPLLYLVFLIPACLLTVIGNNLGDSRDFISFNMSGPFLLFTSCWFFSYIRVTPLELKYILIILIVPIISIATTALFYTVTIEEITFNNESNIATSGGYGPNQVSSILGLGVFICIAAYLLFQNKLKDSIYLGLLAILFAAQSILTFSRGGLYNAMGGILLVIFFQMKNLSQGVKRLIPIIGIILVFLLILFPYLNDFTGGALQERFEDTQATGRMEIIEADLHIFFENPILGAGVGGAKDLREGYLGKAVGAHTEFSRILGEHGVFGLFALIILGIGFVYSLKRQKTSMGKALVAGAVVWSSLFMLNAGMRLAAPSFIWGLSYLTLTVSFSRNRKYLIPVQKKNINC